MTGTTEKLAALTKNLRQRRRVTVALSGGVDSAVLAKAAHLALGDGALAVTVASEFASQRELRDAALTAREIGMAHHVASLAALADPRIAANDKCRCYHCKRLLMATMARWATERGCRFVAEGTNADDVAANDRPGWQAIREAGNVCSPLYEAGLTKAEIRQLAHDWNLSVWSKPSAGCLATRVATGQPLTADLLRRVEAAEAYLAQFASGHLRVRCHGDLARIETGADAMALLAQRREEIVERLTGLGFGFVTLDLRAR